MKRNTNILYQKSSVRKILLMLFVFGYVCIGFAQGKPMTDERKAFLQEEFGEVKDVLESWYISEENIEAAYNLGILDYEFLLEFHNDKAQKSNDTLTLRQIQYPLALTYHNLTRFEKGIPLFESLLLRKESYSKEEYGLILLKLEQEYRAIGRIKDAINIREQRIHLAYTHSFYELYADVGLYNFAIDDYKNTILKPESNPFRLAFYHKDLGNLFMKAEKLDSAIAQYDIGLKIIEPILSKSDYPNKSSYSEYTKNYYASYMKGNIAACRVKQGLLEGVVPILKEDLNASRKILELDNRIIKWLVLADVYIQKKDKQNALRVIDSVENNWQGKRDLSIELELLKIKSEFFGLENVMDSMAFYLNEYVTLKDSIQELNSNDQAVILLTTMDNITQKNTIKEQRLELLRKENIENVKTLQTLLMIFVLVGVSIIVVLLFRNYSYKKSTSDKIEVQNEQLKQKNAENELLLKEVHHRVKNNLQTISSLLGLQSSTVEDQNLKTAFLEGQNRVHSMALLHQRLYESDQLGRVTFKEYAQQLCSNLISTFGKTHVTAYEINSTESFDIENAVPIGLILNEIVTNALKYGMSENGDIAFEISLTNHNEGYNLNVRDHGKGFNIDVAKQKNTLGLRLIHLLSRQLDGKLSITSNNEGTVYNLAF